MPHLLSRLALLPIGLAVLVAASAGCSQTDTKITPGATESSEGEQVQLQPNQQQEQPAEPLTLTLSGPSRCTTTRGQSYGTDEAVYDDEGNYVRSERKFTSHRGVKEFPISWTVSGGTAPYTLTIDGASEDRSGLFTGASGVGMVFCAETTVPTFVNEAGRRGFRARPKIDSGLKTVRALVTDANGRTTEGSIEVYVILRVDGTLDENENDQVLRRGQTYRVTGHLITAPVTHDIYIAGTAEPECPEDLPEDERCEEEWGFGIVGLNAGVNLYRSDFAEASRWPESDGAAGADDSNAALIDDLLDQLVDSVGALPGNSGG